MTKEQFIDQFNKYLAGSCSPQELDALLAVIQDPVNKSWIKPILHKVLASESRHIPEQDNSHTEVLERLLDDKLVSILSRIDTAHSASATSETNANGSRTFWLRPLWGAAAAILLLFAGLYWWYNASTSPSTPPAIVQRTPDFTPGVNKAILTVEGGDQIYLDSTTSGMIGQQGNTSVASTNGQLRYQSTVQQPGAQIIYNTLTTSKGNQYSLVLPDGSKAWLNAASSIRYPVSFVGPVREVEVSGEVYFEVIHNEKQPFIVKAGGQRIEDIGTSFNVHAYPDEKTFKTTLVEGAVKVAGTVLKPGSQASIRDGRLSVLQVDTSQIIAWKNGLFAFHKTPVKEVMRQISRWYDVDVRYENTIPSIRFGGKISRHSNASVVLTILKTSGLNFKIEGRTIIVTGEDQ